MGFLRLFAASAALSFAIATAQYGPNGQYGPDSTSSGQSSSSSAASSSGSSSSSSYGASSRGSVPFGGDFAKANTVIVAHGVCASLAFIVFFPIGGILIRLASFRYLTWVHAAFQVFAYLLFTAAVGMGIWFATQIRYLNHAHPIIGLTLFALLAFQPILGLLHHKLFKKYSRRTLWSYGHIWLGRAVITVGIINGGLGLQLARNAKKYQIAYAVVAAVMWVAYVASIVVGEIKRRKSRKALARVGGEKNENGLRTDTGLVSDEDSQAGHNRQSYSAPPAQGYRYV